MRIGSLIKGKNIDWIGVIIDRHHSGTETYLVQFTNGSTQWWQDYEMELICE